MPVMEHAPSRFIIFSKMNGVEIRPSRPSDLERIMEIYSHARNFMASMGNPTQWGAEYPSRRLVMSDISDGKSFVVLSDGIIAGTFCFIIGPDPTYDVIDGAWKSDAAYGTIHRIASAGRVKGIADAALGFCRRIIGNIRIDTHADNRVMRSWIETRGFEYRGIIHVADGSPRLAYELVPDTSD